MHSPQKQKIVQMMSLFKGKILERPKNIPQSWVCLAKRLHIGPWWTHLCDGGVTRERGDSYCYPHFLGNSLCTEKWTGLRQKFTFCTLRPNYATHVRLSFAAWWTYCSWTLGTLGGDKISRLYLKAQSPEWLREAAPVRFWVSFLEMCYRHALLLEGHLHSCVAQQSNRQAGEGEYKLAQWVNERLSGW